MATEVAGTLSNGRKRRRYVIDDENDESCSICMMEFDGCVASPENCPHCFCLPCLQEWSQNVNTCPIDRIPFHSILVRLNPHGQVTRTIPVEDTTLQVEYDDDNDEVEDSPTFCEECALCDREDVMLLCDICDGGYHIYCLNPPLTEVPEGHWCCPDCEFIDRNNGSSDSSSDKSEEEEARFTDDSDGDISINPPNDSNHGDKDSVVASELGIASESDFSLELDDDEVDNVCNLSGDEESSDVVSLSSRGSLGTRNAAAKPKAVVKCKRKVVAKRKTRTKRKTTAAKKKKKKTPTKGNKVTSRAASSASSQTSSVRAGRRQRKATRRTPRRRRRPGIRTAADARARQDNNSVAATSARGRKASRPKPMRPPQKKTSDLSEAASRRIHARRSAIRRLRNTLLLEEGLPADLVQNGEGSADGLRTCAALPKRAVTPAKASSDVVGGILASMDNVARPGDASVGSGGSLSYRNRPCNDSPVPGSNREVSGSASNCSIHSSPRSVFSMSSLSSSSKQRSLSGRSGSLADIAVINHAAKSCVDKASSPTPSAWSLHSASSSHSCRSRLDRAAPGSVPSPSNASRSGSSKGCPLPGVLSEAGSKASSTEEQLELDVASVSSSSRIASPAADCIVQCPVVVARRTAMNDANPEACMLAESDSKSSTEEQLELDVSSISSSSRIVSPAVGCTPQDPSVVVAEAVNFSFGSGSESCALDFSPSNHSNASLPTEAPNTMSPCSGNSSRQKTNPNRVTLLSDDSTKQPLSALVIRPATSGNDGSHVDRPLCPSTSSAGSLSTTNSPMPALRGAEIAPRAQDEQKACSSVGTAVRSTRAPGLGWNVVRSHIEQRKRDDSRGHKEKELRIQRLEREKLQRLRLSERCQVLQTQHVSGNECIHRGLGTVKEKTVLDLTSSECTGFPPHTVIELDSPTNDKESPFAETLDKGCPGSDGAALVTSTGFASLRKGLSRRVTLEPQGLLSGGSLLPQPPLLANPIGGRAETTANLCDKAATTVLPSQKDTEEDSRTICDADGRKHSRRNRDASDHRDDPEARQTYVVDHEACQTYVDGHASRERSCDSRNDPHSESTSHLFRRKHKRHHHKHRRRHSSLRSSSSPHHDDLYTRHSLDTAPQYHTQAPSSSYSVRKRSRYRQRSESPHGKPHRYSSSPEHSPVHASRRRHSSKSSDDPYVEERQRGRSPISRRHKKKRKSESHCRYSLSPSVSPPRKRKHRHRERYGSLSPGRTDSDSQHASKRKKSSKKSKKKKKQKKKKQKSKKSRSSSKHDERDTERRLRISSDKSPRDLKRSSERLDDRKDYYAVAPLIGLSPSSPSRSSRRKELASSNQSSLLRKQNGRISPCRQNKSTEAPGNALGSSAASQIIYDKRASAPLVKTSLIIPGRSKRPRTGSEYDSLVRNKTNHASTPSAHASNIARPSEGDRVPVPAIPLVGPPSVLTAGAPDHVDACSDLCFNDLASQVVTLDNISCHGGPSISNHEHRHLPVRVARNPTAPNESDFPCFKPISPLAVPTVALPTGDEKPGFEIDPAEYEESLSLSFSDKSTPLDLELDSVPSTVEVVYGSDADARSNSGVKDCFPPALMPVLSPCSGPPTAQIPKSKRTKADSYALEKNSRRISHTDLEHSLNVWSGVQSASTHSQSLSRGSPLLLRDASSAEALKKVKSTSYREKVHRWLNNASDADAPVDGPVLHHDFPSPRTPLTPGDGSKPFPVGSLHDTAADQQAGNEEFDSLLGQLSSKSSVESLTVQSPKEESRLTCMSWSAVKPNQSLLSSSHALSTHPAGSLFSPVLAAAALAASSTNSDPSSLIRRKSATTQQPPASVTVRPSIESAWPTGNEIKSHDYLQGLSSDLPPPPPPLTQPPQKGRHTGGRVLPSTANSHSSDRTAFKARGPLLAPPAPPATQGPSLVKQCNHGGMPPIDSVFSGAGSGEKYVGNASFRISRNAQSSVESPQQVPQPSWPVPPPVADLGLLPVTLPSTTKLSNGSADNKKPFCTLVDFDDTPYSPTSQWSEAPFALEADKDPLASSLAKKPKKPHRHAHSVPSGLAQLAAVLPALNPVLGSDAVPARNGLQGLPPNPEGDVISAAKDKMTFQRLIANEVKVVLRDAFNNNAISKAEYKDILRRAVHKISHGKSKAVRRSVIHDLARGYVDGAVKKRAVVL